MKKRVISLVMAVAVTLTAVSMTACKKEEEQKNRLQKVRLNEVAHSIFYAPMYVAIEEGYFEEEGIDLVLKTGFGAV